MEKHGFQLIPETAQFWSDSGEAVSLGSLDFTAQEMQSSMETESEFYWDRSEVPWLVHSHVNKGSKS